MNAYKNTRKRQSSINSHI